MKRSIWFFVAAVLVTFPFLGRANDQEDYETNWKVVRPEQITVREGDDHVEILRDGQSVFVVPIYNRLTFGNQMTAQQVANVFRVLIINAQKKGEDLAIQETWPERTTPGAHRAFAMLGRPSRMNRKTTFFDFLPRKRLAVIESRHFLVAPDRVQCGFRADGSVYLEVDGLEISKVPADQVSQTERESLGAAMGLKLQEARRTKKRVVVEFDDLSTRYNPFLVGEEEGLLFDELTPSSRREKRLVGVRADQIPLLRKTLFDGDFLTYTAEIIEEEPVESRHLAASYDLSTTKRLFCKYHSGNKTVGYRVSGLHLEMGKNSITGKEEVNVTFSHHLDWAMDPTSPALSFPLSALKQISGDLAAGKTLTDTQVVDFINYVVAPEAYDSWTKSYASVASYKWIIDFCWLE